VYAQLAEVPAALQIRAEARHHVRCEGQARPVAAPPSNRPMRKLRRGEGGRWLLKAPRYNQLGHFHMAYPSSTVEYNTPGLPGTRSYDQGPLCQQHAGLNHDMHNVEHISQTWKM
jgi:hypothetical protein